MPKVSTPDSHKLVSIICRTTGRPELERCLESVIRQTHPALELVLVNATLADLSEVREILDRLTVREVSPDSPLDRPRAANAGLQAATGDYLMFLDEDDWIAEDHVAALVDFIGEQPGIRAVYSSTRKVDSAGAELEQTFGREFDLAILRRDNYIPIHAMLFESSLLESGCRFDESLAIFEDWDFWLQLSQHTPFAHLDRVSAFYRSGGESDTALEDESLKYSAQHPNAAAREKVFEKWLPGYSASEFNLILGSLDNSAELARLEAVARDNDQTVREQQSKLEDLNKAVEAQDADLHELKHVLDEAQERGSHLATRLREFEDHCEELRGERKALMAQNEALQYRIDNMEEHTSQRLKETKEYLAHVQAEHERLQQLHEDLDQGLREVLGSFSWRITAPYRFVSNRIRRYILQPLRGGVKQGAVDVITSNPSLHAAVRKTKAKAALMSKATIHSSLETPSAHSQLFTDQLLVRGWAFSEAGPLIAAVYIDGVLYQEFQPDLPRTDVQEAYSGNELALLSGFDQRIVLDFLAEGEHQVTVVCSDGQSTSVTHQHRFYALDQARLYDLWRSLQLTDLAAATSTAGQQVVVALYAGDKVAGDEDAGNNEISAAASTLHSLASQRHKNWRLHYLGEDLDALLDSLDPALSQSLADRISSSRELAGLADELAEGSVLLALRSGESLHAEALGMMLDALDEQSVKLVHSDHDQVEANGHFNSPVFTFGWSPDHLACSNYVGGVFLLRCDRDDLAYLARGETGDWRYGLLLQQSAVAAERVVRIPKFLWAEPGVEPARQQARLQAEQDAVAAYLRQRELPATMRVEGEFRYLDWRLDTEPLVSIIIPTMGKLDLLKPCLESLLEKTHYGNYELVMLDNSRGRFPEGIEYLKSKPVKLIECDQDFNWSRLNNIGASHADGDYLLFLNDDIEVIQGDWLTELVKQAQRDAVGAVGGLLFYPNGAMQHAGVLLVNYGGGCAHLFHKMQPDPRIYRRLDKTVREVSANTGACLLMARHKFDEVNGFEEELAVVGNDVDLCLRLLERGYRNVWTPLCRLVHHESISRKATVPPADNRAMWKRWGERFKSGDRYYNPQLTQLRWDCSPEIDLSSEALVNGMGKDIQSRPLQLPSTPAPGVTLLGYIRAEMGLGEAARSDARALDSAGIDFNILKFDFGNPSRMTNARWAHKEALALPYDTVLMHINPDFLAMARQGLPANTFDDRYLIAFWAWELEQIPSEWLEAMALVDEIWVPSDFVNDAVSSEATVPVVTIPHCVKVEPDESFDRSYFDIPGDRFVFLAMFDTNSVSERKNPFAAIAAFKQAFRGDDESVCLLLKINNSTGRDESDLRAAIASHPNIVLLHEAYSRDEIDGLLNQVDCYVSLHRSEGFGLGPAEAMSLGKCTIITNWSGNTDYMTDDNCLAVDYQLIELDQDYGPYKRGQRWADPDLAQAAAAMRTLVSDPALAQRLGDNARRSIDESFSPAAVGRRIARRLDEIRKNRSRH